ncbi:helix-turn-helix transcriptional regulator [Propionibacteriaceae bacterium G1746]
MAGRPRSGGTASAARTAKKNTERAMQLFFVLQSTHQPLPKSRIYDAVDRYRDLPRNENLDRMFERDKDLLRDLGVEISTVRIDEEECYLLPSRDLALPDVDFTAEERAMLAVAGQLWNQHSVGEESRQALTKLAAAGVELDETITQAAQPDLWAPEPGFQEFWDANIARRRVRFTYRNNNGEVRERDLEPWVMAQRAGRWYVIGFDRSRGEARKFKLARVVGDPEPYGEAGAYEVSGDLDAPALVASIKPERDAEQAVLAIRGDYAPGLRRRGVVTEHADVPDGYAAYSVAYAWDASLVREVARFGADVLVLEPTSLREAVIRHLRDVVSAHGEGVA